MDVMILDGWETGIYLELVLRLHSFALFGTQHNCVRDNYRMRLDFSSIRFCIYFGMGMAQD